MLFIFEIILYLVSKENSSFHMVNPNGNKILFNSIDNYLFHKSKFRKWDHPRESFNLHCLIHLRHLAVERDYVMSSHQNLKQT